jgi:hypothetical protein
LCGSAVTLRIIIRIDSIRIDFSMAVRTAQEGRTILFSPSRTNGKRELARLDGGYRSTEVAAGFVGQTVGLRAVAGEVQFSRADTRPSADLAVQVHIQVHEGKEGIQ